jgi:hypothetical protein
VLAREWGGMDANGAGRKIGIRRPEHVPAGAGRVACRRRPEGRHERERTPAR